MNSSIHIQTEIKAPIELVWKSYTSPEHVRNWNFASEDWHCPSAEIDLQPGGIYLARMEAKDGSFGFDFRGMIETVSPHSKLAYILDDGRHVETKFETTPNGTLVTTIFDPEMQNPRELQEQGWLAILTNFKQYTETLHSK